MLPSLRASTLWKRMLEGSASASLRRIARASSNAVIARAVLPVCLCKSPSASRLRATSSDAPASAYGRDASSRRTASAFRCKASAFGLASDHAGQFAQLIVCVSQRLP